MRRREFLTWGGRSLLGLSLLAAGSDYRPRAASQGNREVRGSGTLLLFLAGDVMTGRGIDQILPQPSDPVLHESYVKDARSYVELAREENGEIPRPAPFDYPWGDSLALLDSMEPAARIVNLETAVTTSDDWWQGKRIHYRMHPGNVETLVAAGLDVCILANNHVLDWGHSGLGETLTALREAGIETPGAGHDEGGASAPATLETATGRLLVFAYGHPSAGVPGEWRAGASQPGVNMLEELDSQAAERVAREVEAHREPGDRVIVSLHWGGNWGYQIPRQQQEFARALIDAGAADIIHGHSSHHPKGIELYRERLILYGAGDLLNDYEGIAGHEEYRKDLSLMYFPALAPSGALETLEMSPMRVRRFRLEHASEEETRWLAATVARESSGFGARIELSGEGLLRLRRD